MKKLVYSNLDISETSITMLNSKMTLGDCFTLQNNAIWFVVLLKLQE